MHGAGVEGLMSGNIGDVTLNNLQIADSLADGSHDNAVLAKQLHHLLGARIAAMEAKVALLEESAQFENEDGDVEDRIKALNVQIKLYSRAFEGDMQALGGDGKQRKEDIDLIRSEQINEQSQLAVKRKELDAQYAGIFDE